MQQINLIEYLKSKEQSHNFDLYDFDEFIKRISTDFINEGEFFNIKDLPKECKEFLSYHVINQDYEINKKNLELELYKSIKVKTEWLNEPYFVMKYISLIFDYFFKNEYLSFLHKNETRTNALKILKEFLNKFSFFISNSNKIQKLNLFHAMFLNKTKIGDDKVFIRFIINKIINNDFFSKKDIIEIFFFKRVFHFIFLEENIKHEKIQLDEQMEKIINSYILEIENESIYDYLSNDKVIENTVYKILEYCNYDKMDYLRTDNDVNKFLNNIYKKLPKITNLLKFVNEENKELIYDTIFKFFITNNIYWLKFQNVEIANIFKLKEMNLEKDINNYICIESLSAILSSIYFEKSLEDYEKIKENLIKSFCGKNSENTMYHYYDLKKI